VRATLQLIDARTEDHLWADSFDRELTDILALHSEVAQAVADQVEIALTPDEAERLARARHVEPEAYEAYLEGNEFLRTGLTQENYRNAVVSFERAIEADHTYAPAYVGLSDALRRLGIKYRPPTEVLPRAHAAVLRALELDPDLADAYVQLSRIIALWEWDWKGAEAGLLRALELSPNNVLAIHSYAGFLVSTGRVEEALAVEQRAQGLDPLGSKGMTRHPGWLLWYARRYDEAIAYLLETIEADPDNYVSHLYLSWNYWGKGLHTMAVETLEHAGRIYPAAPRYDPNYVACLAFAQGSAGRSTHASATIRQLLELRKRTYVPPMLVAIAYTGVGDTEHAIEWIERAYEVRDPHLLSIKMSPALDPLRSDPRFQDILRRMNFPEN
jgi:tetratricopeptide (TPR) repeat protein